VKEMACETFANRDSANEKQEQPVLSKIPRKYGHHQPTSQSNGRAGQGGDPNSQWPN